MKCNYIFEHLQVIYVIPLPSLVLVTLTAVPLIVAVGLAPANK